MRKVVDTILSSWWKFFVWWFGLDRASDRRNYDLNSEEEHDWDMRMGKTKF